VGGLAVSARAEVRFTRDVDLAVAVADDADAERLVHELATRRYRVRTTVEQEAVARLSTVRLLSPVGVKIDLLFASSGIEPEIVQRAEWMEHGEARVPVARAEELVATKVLSADAERLQDQLDFRSLLSVEGSLLRPRACPWSRFTSNATHRTILCCCISLCSWDMCRSRQSSHRRSRRQMCSRTSPSSNHFCTAKDLNCRCLRRSRQPHWIQTCLAAGWCCSSNCSRMLSCTALGPVNRNRIPLDADKTTNSCLASICSFHLDFSCSSTRWCCWSMAVGGSGGLPIGILLLSRRFRCQCCASTYPRQLRNQLLQVAGTCRGSWWVGGYRCSRLLWYSKNHLCHSMPCRYCYCQKCYCCSCCHWNCHRCSGANPRSLRLLLSNQ
jgi:hypothetical protein